MKQKKITHAKNICITLIALLLCGCNTSVETDTNETDETAVDINELQEEVSKNYSLVLPSPIQLASIYKKSGCEFSDQLLNPYNNINQYNTFNQKAINLGIYSSDLCYTLIHNQKPLSLKYIDAIRKLYESMGIANIFTPNNLFENLEKNIGKLDSIFYLSALIHQQTNEYYQQNQQKYITGLYYTGAWLEGIYIAGNTESKKETKNQVIISRVLEQINLLTNLIELVQQNPDKDEFINSLIVDLKIINTTFLNLEYIKGKNIEDISFEEFIITDNEFANLMGKINTLRNKITNNK